MSYPAELRYTEDHEWISLSADGQTAKVGITEYAQEQLGDVVYIGLPEVGAEVDAEESVADIESVKSVSDIFTPVSGTIAAVNETLEETPELVNSDPYGAWLFEVSPVTSALEKTMSAAEYQQLVTEEG